MEKISIALNFKSIRILDPDPDVLIAEYKSWLDII